MKCADCLRPCAESLAQLQALEGDEIATSTATLSPTDQEKINLIVGAFAVISLALGLFVVLAITVAALIF